MENLAAAIPQVDNILQCCSGLIALSRFLIITAELSKYKFLSRPHKTDLKILLDPSNEQSR